MRTARLRGEEHRGECRHPRAEGGRVLRPLELGERTLESVGGRIEQPLIDETALRSVAGGEAVEGACGGVEVRGGVRGTEVDRRGVDAAFDEIVASGVDGAGGEGGFHGNAPGSVSCS